MRTLRQLLRTAAVSTAVGAALLLPIGSAHAGQQPEAGHGHAGQVPACPAGYHPAVTPRGVLCLINTPWG